MRPKVIKLMLLLASAGWRREEIRQLIYELEKVRVAEIDRIYDEIASFNKYLSGMTTVDDVYGVSRPVSSGSSLSDSVGQRVLRLLREDVGLTNDEIVRSLRKQLANSDPQKAKLIKPYSKKSLATWVDGLTELYPPSEILHVATVMRNSYVHEGDLDWTLRKK